jgi:polycystin 1L2
MASWFLKHIIVRDLQTGEKFYFICEQWMGVEKEDGRIERELFVAGDKQIKELKYLLEKQSKQQMNDSHLWLSIFNKPVQSKFTRLDRVTCGFVFIYTSMLLNILYYEKSLTFFESNKIDFIVFSITFEQVKTNEH